MLLGLFALQSQLWSTTAPQLVLEYRITVEGQSRLKRDREFRYRVKRSYEGSIRLDRREGTAAWDFNFDTKQTNPTLLQTTAVRVLIDDELREGEDWIQSWKAEHQARRALTEATIELDAKRKTYRLVFGIGDTLGATDAVKVTTWTQGTAQLSTLGLTQIPNFGTRLGEFRSCVVDLPQVARNEFTKSWPVTSFSGLDGVILDPSIKVVLKVRIHTPPPHSAD